MVSRKEQEAHDAEVAQKEAAAKKRAREKAEAEREEIAQRDLTNLATAPVPQVPSSAFTERGPRVSPNPGFRPGERLDTQVDDPRLANENTRRDQVEAALSQKFVDTTLYPPTEAQITRQQEEQKAKEEAARRDAAERHFHRKAFAEELGTGINGLLQVLYRRGLVSIPEIEAITGKDIPDAKEKEMEAGRDKAA